MNHLKFLDSLDLVAVFMFISKRFQDTVKYKSMHEYLKPTWSNKQQTRKLMNSLKHI